MLQARSLRQAAGGAGSPVEGSVTSDGMCLVLVSLPTLLWRSENTVHTLPTLNDMLEANQKTQE